MVNAALAVADVVLLPVAFLAAAALSSVVFTLSDLAIARGTLHQRELPRG
jgi:ATP phosphoribosyltransferase regulatory subunit HisZ